MRDGMDEGNCMSELHGKVSRRGSIAFWLLPVVLLLLGGGLVGLQWWNSGNTSTTSNTVTQANDHVPNDDTLPALEDDTIVDQIEFKSYREKQIWQKGKFIASIPGEVSHEFLILNDSDETLELRDFERSCACADLVISDEILKPGEVTSVMATMSLVGAGPRSADIILNWKNDEQTSLVIAAIAVLPASVKVTPRRLFLGADETADVSVTYIVLDTDEDLPDVTLIDPVPGISLSTNAWTVLSWGEYANLIPTRYMMMVQVNCETDIEEELQIQFNIAGTPSEAITIYPK